MMCSTKAFERNIKLECETYLGILKAIESADIDGQFHENDPSEAQETKTEDVPPEIWKICEELAAVLPKDLSKCVSSKRMGHEFKIDWESYTSPTHHTIYELSLIEL